MFSLFSYTWGLWVKGISFFDNYWIFIDIGSSIIDIKGLFRCTALAISVFCNAHSLSQLNGQRQKEANNEQEEKYPIRPSRLEQGEPQDCRNPMGTNYRKYRRWLSCSNLDIKDAEPDWRNTTQDKHSKILRQKMGYQTDKEDDEQEDMCICEGQADREKERLV